MGVPRRRRCGDIVEERQRRRYAPWPPRPAGLRLRRPANHCGLPVMIQLGMGAAAKCQIILARALSSTDEHRFRVYLCSSMISLLVDVTAQGSKIKSERSEIAFTGINSTSCTW